MVIFNKDKVLMLVVNLPGKNSHSKSNKQEQQKQHLLLQKKQNNLGAKLPKL
jgi:hypothetical protein